MENWIPLVLAASHCVGFIPAGNAWNKLQDSSYYYMVLFFMLMNSIGNVAVFLPEYMWSLQQLFCVLQVCATIFTCTFFAARFFCLKQYFNPLVKVFPLVSFLCFLAARFCTTSNAQIYFALQLASNLSFYSFLDQTSSY